MNFDNNYNNEKDLKNAKKLENLYLLQRVTSRKRAGFFGEVLRYTAFKQWVNAYYTWKRALKARKDYKQRQAAQKAAQARQELQAKMHREGR